MASESTNSDAFRDFIRIQPAEEGREDLPPGIPGGIVVVSLENIADEYHKADKDAGNMAEGFRSRGVQQVPLALAVKGPISLRRGGLLDRESTGSPDTPIVRWNEDDSYKVTVGKQGAS